MGRLGELWQGRRRLAASHAASLAASFSVRLALFYGALFLIYGVHLPFLPIWLDARGLSPQEIAFITATPFFLRVLITPAVALVADHTDRHRTLVIGLAWLSFGLAMLLTQMESFWAIFFVAVPFAIAFSTMMPLTETIAVAGVRARGVDYGHMRLWGSLTFVGAGFAGGWAIDHAGPVAALGCILAAAGTTAACAWLLPERPPALQPPTAQPTGPTQRSSATSEALKLFRSPVFLLFLLAVGSAQGAHGMFYTFGALELRGQGVSTAWIGALWAIAIAGEVMLFAYSGSVMRRWGPATLMIAATGAGIVRWTAMSFSPPLVALVVLQTLHTLTYGASHLGAMHFISRAVPDSAQGTAQALYATMAAGLLMGGATLLSGWLYAKVGGHAYLAMTVLSVIGLMAALFVRARWDGELLWSTATA